MLNLLIKSCYSHHVSGLGETNSHPSLGLSLHVDVKDPRVSSVGVDSNETGTVGHVTSVWSAEGKTVLLRVTHLEKEIKIVTMPL